MVGKLEIYHRKRQLLHTLPETKSKDQLKEGIELLQDKAIERIRDFIILQIRMLRSSSKSSSQLIQQKLLEVKMHSNFAVPPSKIGRTVEVCLCLYYAMVLPKQVLQIPLCVGKLQIRRVDSAVLGDNKAGEYFTLFEKIRNITL